MDVRIDVVDGQTIPKDTFVSLRIGSTRLQSRLSSSRTFTFPGDAREASCGRLELYSQLGGADAGLNASTSSSGGSIGLPTKIEIPCDHPQCGNSTLTFQISTSLSEKAPRAPAAERRKRVQAEVDQYMAKHSVVSDLAIAMQELLHDKPQCPHRFLSEFLLKRAPSGEHDTSTNARATDTKEVSQSGAAANDVTSLQAQLEAALRGKAEAENELKSFRQRSDVQSALPTAPGFAAYYRTHVQGCCIADNFYAKFSQQREPSCTVVEPSSSVVGSAEYYRRHVQGSPIGQDFYSQFPVNLSGSSNNRILSLEAELEAALRARAEAENELKAVRQRSTVQAALLQISRSSRATQQDNQASLESEIHNIRERYVARTLLTQTRAATLQKRLAEMEAKAPKEPLATATATAHPPPPEVPPARTPQPGPIRDMEVVRRQQEMLNVEIEELGREREEVEAVLSQTKQLGGASADLEWVLSEVDAALAAARREYAALNL